MSQTSLMTSGLLLILTGVQLNLVESFVLTPRATEFWNERVNGGDLEIVPADYKDRGNGYFTNSTTRSFSRSSTANQNGFPYSVPSFQRFRTGAQSVGSNFDGRHKMITVPTWFCWPPIFLGAAMFLFGAAGRL